MAKLGSPKSTHTAEGQQMVRKIEREAETVVSASKAGRCTTAQIAYAEMHNAVGAVEAHMRSGGKLYIPTTTLQEASYEFTTRCVRDAGGLDGGLGRKRRRR